ncbi:hypothetical protein GCM10009670_13580 [Citricoccus alkalitolerans]
MAATAPSTSGIVSPVSMKKSSRWLATMAGISAAKAKVVRVHKTYTARLVNRTTSDSAAFKLPVPVTAITKSEISDKVTNSEVKTSRGLFNGRADQKPANPDVELTGLRRLMKP